MYFMHACICMYVRVSIMEVFIYVYVCMYVGIYVGMYVWTEYLWNLLEAAGGPQNGPGHGQGDRRQVVGVILLRVSRLAELQEYNHTYIHIFIHTYTCAHTYIPNRWSSLPLWSRQKCWWTKQRAPQMTKYAEYPEICMYVWYTGFRR